jgi:ribosomal protein S16
MLKRGDKHVCFGNKSVVSLRLQIDQVLQSVQQGAKSTANVNFFLEKNESKANTQRGFNTWATDVICWDLPRF